MALIKTKGRHEIVWLRQTVKWTLTRQVQKTGNLFVLFNHWQSWWQGESWTFYLEKRANRTAWQLPMKPDGLLSLTHYSAISPHSFPPVHIAQAVAGIQLAPLLSNRKGQFLLPGIRSCLLLYFIFIFIFYNPTYQLNSSTTCSEVLQYSRKKKNSTLIFYGCQ